MQAHTPTISILLIQTHVLTVPAGQIRRYDSLLQRKWHEQDRKLCWHHTHTATSTPSRCKTYTLTQSSSKDADVSSVTPHTHTRGWTSEIPASWAFLRKDADCVHMAVFQLMKHLNFWCIWNLSCHHIFSTGHSTSTISSLSIYLWHFHMLLCYT